MAEKKSMKGKAAPKKRAAQKVEEPKPANDVQPLTQQVKPREINWDVIGFSSAAVTFVGAALVFMIGWTHEANWFGYFGISLSQLDLSPQYIFAQALPTLFTILWFLGISILLNIAWELIRNLTIEINSIQSIQRITLCYIFIYFSVIAQSLLRLSKLGVITFFPFSSLSPDFTGSDFVFFIRQLLLFIAAFIVITLYSGKAISIFARGSSIAYMLLVLLSCLSIAALEGYLSAAQGFHLVGRRAIQSVYLVSNRPLLIEKDLLFTCAEDQCFYGPFGLVAENSTSFFLIRYTQADFFPREPGLYIFPRNQEYYYVPNETAKVVQEIFPANTLASTATLAIMPTFTSTTPTLRPTIAPTSTPNPSQP